MQSILLFRLTVAFSLFVAASTVVHAQKPTPAPPKPTPAVSVEEVAAGGPVAPLQRGAVLTEKVPNYDAAARDILDAVTRASGTLSDTKSQVGDGGRRSGWMRLRVPAERLPVLIADVRRTGVPYAEKMTTTDNASEYQSLLLRVNRLKQHEGRLESVLSADRRMRGSDILYLQERLFRASVDESLLLQQREDFARNAQSSSLIVFLFEPTPTNTLSRVHLDASAHFTYARTRALETLTKALQRGITGSAYALVYAPLYLPLVLLAVFAIYRLRDPISAMMRAVAVVLRLFARIVGEGAKAATTAAVVYGQRRQAAAAAAPAKEVADISSAPTGEEGA